MEEVKETTKRTKVRADDTHFKARRSLKWDEEHDNGWNCPTASKRQRLYYIGAWIHQCTSSIPMK